MKTNLRKLASELARKDAPGGFNASVITTETCLAALGKKLRCASVPQALEIINAIVVRSGKR